MLDRRRMSMAICFCHAKLAVEIPLRSPAAIDCIPFEPQPLLRSRHSATLLVFRSHMLPTAAPGRLNSVLAASIADGVLMEWAACRCSHGIQTERAEHLLQGPAAMGSHKIKTTCQPGWLNGTFLGPCQWSHRSTE